MYQVIYMGGGWIGDVVFFTISVWFLLDRNLTIKNSFKRIWLLERELLFWSLTLFVVTLVLHRTGVYSGGITYVGIQSILPISMNLWWYPTSYALFLLFLPYLSRGLRALSKKLHGTLALSVLLLWGVAGLIPQFTFNLTEKSVFVFIYLAILISYYKWYMREFSVKTCATIIAGGFAVNTLYWLLANILYLHTGKKLTLQNFPFDHWMITEVMMGFALFVLFSKMSWHSKFVNVLAGSAFGIYLIHTYPSIQATWASLFPMPRVYNGAWSILTGLLAILIIYVGCLILDLIRQGLFKLTIDKHRGKLFERFYGFLTRKIASIQKRYISKEEAQQ